MAIGRRESPPGVRTVRRHRADRATCRCRARGPSAPVVRVRAIRGPSSADCVDTRVHSCPCDASLTAFAHRAVADDHGEPARRPVRCPPGTTCGSAYATVRYGTVVLPSARSSVVALFRPTVSPADRFVCLPPKPVDSSLPDAEAKRGPAPGQDGHSLPAPRSAQDHRPPWSARTSWSSSNEIPKYTHQGHREPPDRQCDGQPLIPRLRSLRSHSPPRSRLRLGPDGGILETVPRPHERRQPVKPRPRTRRGSPRLYPT